MEIVMIAFCVMMGAVGISAMVGEKSKEQEKTIRFRDCVTQIKDVEKCKEALK